MEFLYFRLLPNWNAKSIWNSWGIERSRTVNQWFDLSTTHTLFHKTWTFGHFSGSEMYNIGLSGKDAVYMDGNTTQQVYKVICRGKYNSIYKVVKIFRKSFLHSFSKWMKFKNFIFIIFTISLIVIWCFFFLQYIYAYIRFFLFFFSFYFFVDFFFFALPFFFFFLDRKNT